MSIIIRDRASDAVESIPKQLPKTIMVGMEVPIGPVLYTKDDLHARKTYSKRSNFRICPVNNTYDEAI
jgi:hypothetical protein